MNYIIISWKLYVCKKKVPEADVPDTQLTVKENSRALSPGEVCIGVLFLHSLLDGNRYGDSHTDHRVVTCSEEAHHFDMRGY